MSNKTKGKKSKKDRAPKGRRYKLRRLWAYLRLLPANLAFWLRAGRMLKRAPLPYQPHELSANFFGINVAPGDTLEHDNYLIARVKDLGLNAVRIDYGYGEESSIHATRLIDRLHAEGFSVLLHLIPPRSEAIYLGRKKVSQRWRDFVEGALARFAGKIVAVEIGAAINRFTWSGYSMTSYVHSAKQASRICRERGVNWYGPNVTDYSPLTNVGVLGLLRRAKALPDCHTNNLFVDRAGQPENYDPKVGFGLSRKMDKNFINKSRWLVAISRYFGVPRTISTYAYWTLRAKKLSKLRYVGEDQYARYLVRYFTLAAAGGLLDRAYWGQMISAFKGLIDDGSKHAPQIPAPHHTWKLKGKPEDYKIRPAFQAYATLVRNLKGASFCRRIPTFGGTYLFEFIRPSAERKKKEERLLIGWTRDGMQDKLESCLGESISGFAHAENLAGEKLAGKLPLLNSSPTYFTFHEEPPIMSENVEYGDYLTQLVIPPTKDEECAYQAFKFGRFRGIARGDLLTPELIRMLANPPALFELEGARQIKKGVRRRLADIPFPLCSKESGNPGRAIFKRYNPRKKGFEFSRSRAARCWENSARLCRMGVETPRPLVLIEDDENPTRMPSYLITEKVEDALEVRAMLKAYRKGKPAPIDVPREAFLHQLGLFIRQLHRCKLFHRDLSGGNIMIGRKVTQTPEGPQLKITLIDNDRVRFPRAMGWLRRHRDLARIRHAPEDRWAFYLAYNNNKVQRAQKHWRQFRLIYILYRIKFNLKKPKRLLRVLKGTQK